MDPLKAFFKNWCDIRILQNGWKFSFSYGFIEKSQIYSAKIPEFFFRILMGISVACVAFHEYSFLIYLKTSYAVTWLKWKLNLRFTLLIAMIIEWLWNSFWQWINITIFGNILVFSSRWKKPTYSFCNFFIFC